MTYKELVKCWHQGVLAADKSDLDSALRSFTSIEDPPSKIWYNIGCIHLQRDDLLNALQAYSQSVTKDPCLAVGFFQRSFVHFKLQWYEKALGDCHLAMAQLRNNSVIDYKQLGLHHLLHAWEVLYNTAVILCYLGKWESAEQKISEAVTRLPGEIRNAKLEAAQAQILSRSLLQPIQVPDGEIFRPRKQQVEQLDSKDFLGKPKVISSVVPNDQYSGFEPLRPQRPGFYQPCPDFMQGRDSGYHRVMVHYYPENSVEVAVKANSILFVLNKHGDWATAIHDGQKILIPTNFLEPVDAPKVDMKRINNGIPLPPMKMPPTRPNAKAAGNPLSSQHVPPRPTADLPIPSEKTRIGDLGAPPKEDQDGDEEETVVSAPPEEQSGDEADHPGPVEMTAPTVIRKTLEPPPLQRVEMVVNLQSGATVSQEGETGTNKGPVHEVESPPLEEDVITLKVHTEFTVDLSFSKNITYQELQRLLRNKLKQQGEQMDVQLSYRDIEGKELTSVKDDGDLQGMWKQAKNKSLMLCCKASKRPVKNEESDLIGCYGQLHHSSSTQVLINLPHGGFLLRAAQYSSTGCVSYSSAPVDLTCNTRHNPGQDAHHCVGRPILRRMKAVYTYTAEGPEDLPFRQGDIIEIFSEVNEQWLEGHCNGSIGIFPRCFATNINEQDES